MAVGIVDDRLDAFLVDYVIDLYLAVGIVDNRLDAFLVNYVVDLHAAVRIVDDRLDGFLINYVIDLHTAVGVVDDALNSFLIDHIIDLHAAVGIIDQRLYSRMINHIVDLHLTVGIVDQLFYCIGVNNFIDIYIVDCDLRQSGLINQIVAVVVVQKLLNGNLTVLDQPRLIGDSDISGAVNINIAHQIGRIAIFRQIELQIRYVDKRLELANQRISGRTADHGLQLFSRNVHLHNGIGYDLAIRNQSFYLIIINNFGNVNLSVVDEIQNLSIINNLRNLQLAVVDQGLHLGGINNLRDLQLAVVDQILHLGSINNLRDLQLAVIDQTLHLVGVNDLRNLQLAVIDQILHLIGVNDLRNLQLAIIDQILHLIGVNNLRNLQLAVVDQILHLVGIHNLRDLQLAVIDQILHLVGINDLADRDLVVIDQSLHLIGINNGTDGNHAVLDDLLYVKQLFERGKIKAVAVDRLLQICNQHIQFVGIVLDRVDQSDSVLLGNAAQNQVFLRLSGCFGDNIPLLQQRQSIKTLVQSVHVGKQSLQLCQRRIIVKNLLDQSLGINIVQQSFQSQLIGNLLDIEHLEPVLARDDVEQILHRECLAQCRDVNRCTFLEALQQILGNSVTLQNLRERLRVQSNRYLGAIARGFGVHVRPCFGEHAQRKNREHCDQRQYKGKNFVENLHNKTSLLLEIPPPRRFALFVLV